MRGHGELLQVTRRLPAPPERVFRAFTEATELERWWWPEPSVEIDARPGGAYHLTDARYGIGLAGRFTEVDAPRRLAFTWQWDGEDRRTLVTVEFHDRGGATELVVTHGGFADAAERDQHVHGWSDCLDRLDRLEGVGAAAEPPATGAG